MSDRRRNRDDLAAAEQQARESSRRAERDAAAARQVSREASDVAERIRALNASNGFAELLYDAVIRGSR